MEPLTPSPKPSIKELGLDLMTLSGFQLWVTLFLPFAFFVLYFLLAANNYWIPAVLSTMALSFTTYGSTSHDLVHENLKLNKTLNAAFLSILELLCFRSGHAYKLSHLYHHKRFPHEDDVEGAASRMSLGRTLVEGVVFQFKIYFWALSQSRGRKFHTLIIVEGVSVLAFIAFCIYSAQYTSLFLVYMFLMIAGSWIIPLVTSYLVHTPHGANELRQTRLFRGAFFSAIAFNHLFHLEHHLYPMVPHKNWPRLASRLDAYFRKEGIEPLEVKF